MSDNPVCWSHNLLNVAEIRRSPSTGYLGPRSCDTSRIEIRVADWGNTHAQAPAGLTKN